MFNNFIKLPTTTMHTDIVFIFLLSSLNCLAILSEEAYTLKTLNVIFRHGDRTPIGVSGDEYYPKDPHINKTFYPVGYGGLTNEGKQREFQIGKSLRTRYSDFLGPTYMNSQVSVHSTDTLRTKMSALLVLAGLFPPKDKQVWSNSLSWQPIPVLNPPTFLDAIYKSSACPVYRAEMKRVKESAEYLKDISQFKTLMKELTFFTGKKITDTEQIFYLFHLLTAEKASKLVLPQWTKRYYPYGPMRNATLFHYHTMGYNNLLKTFNGGMAIQKALRNLMKNIEDEERVKIHLYGAHETNIAGILVALNLWKNLIPEYSSSLVFELHQKNSEYYIKLLYYKGVPPEFETLVLPGCTEYCRIDDFIKLNIDILPNISPMEICFGPVKSSELVPANENSISWMYKQFTSWYDM